MLNKLREKIAKLACIAGALSVSVISAAHAEGETPLSTMVQAVDLSDAQGAIILAAGSIITLLVLVWGIRRVFAMFQGR